MAQVSQLPQDGSIDAGLLVLDMITSGTDGDTLTVRDIADFCGCHANNIWQIEQRALRKLRRALDVRGLKLEDLVS